MFAVPQLLFLFPLLRQGASFSATDTHRQAPPPLCLGLMVHQLFFLHNSALEPLPTEDTLKVSPFPGSNGVLFFFLSFFLFFY